MAKLLEQKIAPSCFLSFSNKNSSAKPGELGERSITAAETERETEREKEGEKRESAVNKRTIAKNNKFNNNFQKFSNFKLSDKLFIQ